MMEESTTFHNELIKPIIFIGVPRSGTSVISEIIMRHKSLGFPSQHQNRFINNTSHNHLRKLCDNKYWRFFGQKKQLNNVDFSNKLIFRPSENYAMWNAITEDTVDFSRDFLLNRTASTQSIKRIRKYFYDIVKKQGKDRLAFKITGPSRLQFLCSIFPDAQVIRIHRNFVPTISSLLKVQFWESRGMHQLWWTGAYSMEEIKIAQENTKDAIFMTAFQIKKVNDITDAEIANLKLSVLNINYKDFVKEPELIIKRILDYTNLSNDPACYNYLKKNKIYNQNKNDNEYFNSAELELIYKIFKS